MVEWVGAHEHFGLGVYYAWLSGWAHTNVGT